MIDHRKFVSTTLKQPPKKYGVTRLHYVRDVTYDDRSRVRTGTGVEVIAVLRNLPNSPHILAVNRPGMSGGSEPWEG